MKTPVTVDRLKQHLAYSLWKYILLGCLVVFGWNIIFTVTAYRPPKEKIVDLYIYGYGDYDPLNEYMEKIRTTEMQDMEQMTAVLLPVDETYGMMALSTRVAAGEGDLYLLPREIFQTTASESWFQELDDETWLQDFCAEHGINLERCWRRSNETSERHLYAIPVSALPGLEKLIYATDEYYLSVLANNGNPENVMKFLSILLRDMGPDAVPAAAE